MLDLIHKGVFGLMLLMFTYGNYIVVKKFLTMRQKVNSPLHKVMSYAEGLKSGLWYLDFAATVSPIVGLLGTVLALIIAFQSLAERGVSGAGEISAAIGTALWATAAGIAMSLWFYFFFKLFQAKISSIKEEAKLRLLKELEEEENEG